MSEIKCDQNNKNRCSERFSNTFGLIFDSVIVIIENNTSVYIWSERVNIGINEHVWTLKWILWCGNDFCAFRKEHNKLSNDRRIRIYHHIAYCIYGISKARANRLKLYGFLLLFVLHKVIVPFDCEFYLTWPKSILNANVGRNNGNSSQRKDGTRRQKTGSRSAYAEIIISWLWGKFSVII